MSERVFLVVGYDGAELLDIACVTSALDLANRIGADPPYRPVLAAPGRRDSICDSGLRLSVGAAVERINEPLDTLLVTGGLGHETAAANPKLVGHVRRLATLAGRVASVCTGATVLAEAGLLADRRVATHWRYADRLARRYPAVRVDPGPIYIRDGAVATSAGVTSALDLTLSFIEEDHGPALARRVALGLVAYLQRPGGQSQMSMFLDRDVSDDGVVRRVTDHVRSQLDGDLGTGTLARRVGVSERHLTRLFRRAGHGTPSQYVRRVRTDAAAHLLVSSPLQLSAVAHRCGFGSTESLRQAFLERHGVPPSRYRRERTAGIPSPVAGFRTGSAARPAAAGAERAPSGS